MRKISSLLIMALIFRLVPLISFTPEASASSGLPTLSSSSIASIEPYSNPNPPSVSISVYSVTYGVYFYQNSDLKSFKLPNDFHGEIEIQITGEIKGHSFVVTDSSGYEAYQGVPTTSDQLKVVFPNIQIDTAPLFGKQIFLKIGTSSIDEQDVYFIGKIPEGYGIAKVHLINSPHNPSGFYLEDWNLPERIKKYYTSYDTIDFYLVPANPTGSVGGNLNIKEYMFWESSKTTNFNVPETEITEGQLKSINIHTSQDITVKFKDGLKPSDASNYMIMPFRDDYGFFNWLINNAQPFGEGRLVEDGEVTFQDVPLGSWRFFPKGYVNGDDVDSKYSLTFVTNAEVLPSLTIDPIVVEFQNVYEKNPSGKFDIRDIVAQMRQYDAEDSSHYILESVLLGVRTQVIDDSHYYDSWFR
jgi:hypothetical protein